ncbi:MAG TPA: hypothetical protein VLB44_14785 [Kofleriaceae bacterium]|nr:hypothetical protein [Kofleriaceae bacterium]
MSQVQQSTAEQGISYSRASDAFNASRFSRFINSRAGRVFRVVAGAGFATVGVMFRTHALGIAALAWSVLPLSAGAFDLCFISAALGGPLSGATIRAQQAKNLRPSR